MTAEIAIINSQGIALAADSAVTIGRERVWKTANKLFSLGPSNDIAVMIYNAGEFQSVPWEAIIKNFRVIVAGKKFNTVEDCERDFFKYLDGSYFDDEGQAIQSMTAIMVSFVDELKKMLTYKSLKELEEALVPILIEINDTWAAEDKTSEFIPEPQFKKLYRANLKVIARQTFGFRLSASAFARLENIIFQSINSRKDSKFMSGIVFAGYGSNQLLPYLSHYIVDGKSIHPISKTKKKGVTRFWLKERHDFSGPSDQQPSAFVLPFAQFDMFYLFMEGIAPMHMTFLYKTLTAVFNRRSESLINQYVTPENKVVETAKQQKENDAIVQQIGAEFTKFRKKKLVTPVLNVVEALPKEEMGAMAEALVELTALRRKVGSSLETVGGPTDVMIISKGEGVVWLKRKHYFNLALNDDYATRKRMVSAGG